MICNISGNHPKILDLLSDKDSEVRIYAVEALQELKHYDPKLIELLDDEDSNIRRVAAIALKKISAERQKGYKILRDIKSKYGLTNLEYHIGEVIQLVHQSLKPQGYIPPEKLKSSSQQ